VRSLIKSFAVTRQVSGLCLRAAVGIVDLWEEWLRNLRLRVPQAAVEPHEFLRL
jgi:hypothetical protein